MYEAPSLVVSDGERDERVYLETARVDHGKIEPPKKS